MRNLLLSLVAIVLLFTGCALFKEGGAGETIAQQSIDQMYSDGKITREQHDVLTEALHGNNSAFWQLLIGMGSTVLSVALAYFGINWKRGPVESRVGLAESLMKLGVPMDPRAVAPTR